MLIYSLIYTRPLVLCCMYITTTKIITVVWQLFHLHHHLLVLLVSYSCSFSFLLFFSFYFFFFYFSLRLRTRAEESDAPPIKSGRTATRDLPKLCCLETSMYKRMPSHTVYFHAETGATGLLRHKSSNKRRKHSGMKTKTGIVTV